MAPSGHIRAQMAHPMHASGFTGSTYSYPFEFTFVPMAKTPLGQNLMQYPQLLHRSATISTFAMFRNTPYSE